MKFVIDVAVNTGVSLDAIGVPDTSGATEYPEVSNLAVVSVPS